MPREGRAPTCCARLWKRPHIHVITLGTRGYGLLWAPRPGEHTVVTSPQPTRHLTGFWDSPFHATKTSLGEFRIQRSSAWGFPPLHRALPTEHQAQILSNMLSNFFGRALPSASPPEMVRLVIRGPERTKAACAHRVTNSTWYLFLFFQFRFAFFSPELAAKSCFTDVLFFMFQLTLIKIEMPWSFTNAHGAQKLQAVLFPLLLRSSLIAGKALPFSSN